MDIGAEHPMFNMALAKLPHFKGVAHGSRHAARRLPGRALDGTAKTCTIAWLIGAEHLALVARPPRDEGVPAVSAPAVAALPTETATSTLTVAEQEKRLIVEAIRRTGGNKARAGAALGLSPTQLLRVSVALSWTGSLRSPA